MGKAEEALGRKTYDGRFQFDVSLKNAGFKKRCLFSKTRANMRNVLSQSLRENWYDSGHCRRVQ